jgi:hypothetical protein
LVGYLRKTNRAVRYHALVDILGRKEADLEVKESHSRIPQEAWAQDILDLQKPQGYWERAEPSWNKDIRGWMEFLYRPKFTATNWRALVLADLGLTAKDKRIKKIANLFFDYKLRLGSPFNFFPEEPCIVGNTARMLTKFGYFDDFRVQKLYARLFEDQKEYGGWNCYRPDRGTLDNWEPLAAYAAIPKQKRIRSIKQSIFWQEEPSSIWNIGYSKREREGMRRGLDSTIRTTTTMTS